MSEIMIILQAIMMVLFIIYLFNSNKATRSRTVVVDKENKKEKIKRRRLQRRISGVNALCCFGLVFDAERFRFSAGSQQIFTLHQCFVLSNSNGCRCSGSDSSRF